jgi:hypothetical protein
MDNAVLDGFADGPQSSSLTERTHGRADIPMFVQW